VNYDVKTKAVSEWNVGCEKCHGPGSAHVARPSRATIINPTRLDPISAVNVCVQCHSQGRPLVNPVEGRHYDWPVGFRVGLNLTDFWELEEHKPGETTFTHFADGTAHKNRMQGNDFVQSVMYTRGVTCASCHDVHGTQNNADLIKSTRLVCLTCHGPKSPNGPHTGTIEQHTHHQAGSAGSECVSCHMPPIEQTIGDVMVRSHTFKFISPSLSESLKVPNPCIVCHKDKTNAWASEALKKWPEFSPWRVGQ
jgi:predicted CXXCH cytochrome family protein